MVIAKDFMEKVKSFGLNSYEAKLWVALLSRGSSTAGELSDIANVPRSRTYDVLESLEKKGFIIMKLGKPIKYLAVEPSEVVKRVQLNIKKDADLQIKSMEEINSSDLLNELTLLHKNGIESVNPSEHAGSFRGRDSTYDHLETMFKSAEKSITIVTTEKGFIRKISYFGKTLEKAAKRGVKIKIAAKIQDKSVLDSVKDFAEIRNTDLRSRFVIVDGEEILFMIVDDEDVHPSYDVGVWVNTPFFANALEQLFELSWKSMKIVH
jgi:sugar-specific transcriptional regulator TrmB